MHNKITCLLKMADRVRMGPVRSWAGRPRSFEQKDIYNKQNFHRVANSEKPTRFV